MAQFVLRYNGSSTTPAVHLDSIRSTPGVQVLDESPRMMLVSGEESTLSETLHAKLKELPGWSIYPLQETPLPDTRKKPR